MSEDPRGSGPRPDLQPRLRAAALTAVIAGVLLLAAAAFVLSYAGIHRIALAAGVSPGLARLYPLIFDAMLVIAGSAVLATRTAGWGTRAYVWGCLLLLLAGVATGDAVHAMNIALPRQQSRAAVAVTPWVLLLLAFGLLLAMLRHLRKARPASGHNRHSTQAGHVRPTAATTAAPGMRALPAGEADVAAPAASGAPGPGVAAGGVAAGGGAAAHGGTDAARPSAATAGNPRARPPAAAARDVAGRVAPGSHEAPGGAQPDSAAAAVEPHAGKRPPVGGRPAGAGLGFPPDEGYIAAPVPEAGVYPGRGRYPESSAHPAHPGPGAGGGQAAPTDYPGTEDYTEHIVYAEPEIANAGAEEEGEAEPESGTTKDNARNVGEEHAGHAGEEDVGDGGEADAQGTGPGAPAPTVPAPAPIPQFDRLRSSPTPPQD